MENTKRRDKTKWGWHNYNENDVKGVQHKTGVSWKQKCDNRYGIDHSQEWWKARRKKGKLESPTCIPPSRRGPTCLDGSKILKWILNKQGGRVWNGFMTHDRDQYWALVITVMDTTVPYKTKGISWLAQWLLGSQEWLCSMWILVLRYCTFNYCSKVARLVLKFHHMGTGDLNHYTIWVTARLLTLRLMV